MTAALRDMAAAVQARGRYGDTVLAHVNPIELGILAAFSPTGRLTTNPDTGLPEAFLPLVGLLGGLAGNALLGTTLGSVGATALGTGLANTLATGDLQQGITSGLMSAVTGGLMGGPASAGLDAATKSAAGPLANVAAKAAAPGVGSTVAGALGQKAATGGGLPTMGQFGDRFMQGLSDTFSNPMGLLPLLMMSGGAMDSGGGEPPPRRSSGPTGPLPRAGAYDVTPAPIGYQHGMAPEHTYIRRPEGFAMGGPVTGMPYSPGGLTSGQAGGKGGTTPMAPRMPPVLGGLMGQRMPMARFAAGGPVAGQPSWLQNPHLPPMGPPAQPPGYMTVDGIANEPAPPAPPAQPGVPSWLQNPHLPPMGPPAQPPGYMTVDGIMNPEGGSPERLVEEAIAALTGQHPQPDQAIARFVERFGEAALQDLIRRITGGGEGLTEGPGTGMSDSIPAMIDGQQPAALSDGEYVVPADVVSGLGDGSTQAGSQKLDNMVGGVRQARTGVAQQPAPIDDRLVLPTEVEPPAFMRGGPVRRGYKGGGPVRRGYKSGGLVRKPC